MAMRDLAERNFISVTGYAPDGSLLFLLVLDLGLLSALHVYRQELPDLLNIDSTESSSSSLLPLRLIGSNGASTGSGSTKCHAAGREGGASAAPLRISQGDVATESPVETAMVEATRCCFRCCWPRLCAPDTIEILESPKPSAPCEFRL